MIGREQDRATARALLIDQAVPLLTLTGPGGVGKTRLALEVATNVADHFTDGVVWVDLASLADAALVAQVVAAAVGLPPGLDRPLEAELARVLHPRQTLLAIDNCEHVLAGVADVVSGLLTECPAVQVIASSRAPIHVYGERVMPVDPLAPPAEHITAWGEISQNSAVRLFVERAQSRYVRFKLTEDNAGTVAAICRALDGLPLAIELAAARMTVLSPAAVLAQMTDRLTLLRDGPRDAPTRQQTIEAAITWSYDLLTPSEQSLCRCLAVFTGGFTLAAVQAVADEGSGSDRDIIKAFTTLVDHSLVQRIEGPDGPRFSTLETIRAFCGYRLRASGEEAAARERHAAYYEHLVASLETWLVPHLPNSDRILEQLAAEYPNLRAALIWCQETNDVSNLLQLAGDLQAFWTLRGHLQEGRHWLEWGLRQDVAVPPRTRAMAQLALADVLTDIHESLPAMALAQQSLAHFQEDGDAARSARAYEQVAQVSLNLDGPEAAKSYLDGALQVLASISNCKWARGATSHILWLRGVSAKNSGDMTAAKHFLGQALELQDGIAAESGRQHPYTCLSHLAIGAVAQIEGDMDDALQHYRVSLSLAMDFQISTCAVFTLARIAGMLASAGRWQEAAWLFGATEVCCEEQGLDFNAGAWQLTRAFGLPQPWQGPENYSGQPAGVRAAVLHRLRAPLPPLPDLTAAAEYWAAGRGVTFREAVSHALTVDLSIQVAPEWIEVLTRLHPEPSVSLTRREQEVLALLCRRRTNAEIAEHLVLSRRTVEDYVDRLLGKLNASNRREAAARAARLGLLTPDLIPLHLAE